MKILLFTILLLISLQSFAQTSDTIYWTPCYKLKLEDFKGKPDTTKIDLANSYIQIDYTYNVVNGKLLFNVNCYFLKNLSWSKYDMAVLNEHEQCHFDIAKLFALKLEQRFTAYKLSTNVRYDLQVIYKTIVAERLLKDNTYDKIEKENPNTATTQNKFEKAIREQLPFCKKIKRKVKYALSY
jgi:Bacterial protein of unknown function (DUF922)